MPTYEYACAKCGHEFDHFQSMKDKPLTVCPKEKCKKKKWGKGRVKRGLSCRSERDGGDLCLALDVC